MRSKAKQSSWFKRSSRAAGVGLALGVMVVAAIMVTPSVHAQTFDILYTFHGTDGGGPWPGLIQDAAGNLYGATYQGGDLSCYPPYGCGTIFKLDSGGTETVLHSFTGTLDGSSPYGALVSDPGGNLYGTAAYGGDFSCGPGCGTVFKVDPSGDLTVLHAFAVGADGTYPFAGLMRDGAGNLYGTTANGGAFGFGAVFKVDRSGAENVLYSFHGRARGFLPEGALIHDAAGSFYGVTEQGGAGRIGTIFKLNPTTGQQTVLYSFLASDGDGDSPVAGLVKDAAGNLYGTTLHGGAFGYGSVFMFNVKTRTETVLYSFSGGADGAESWAPVLLDSMGNLYGTTSIGGDLTCYAPYGCGTVFKLDTSGSLTVLHTFSGGTDGGTVFGGLLRDSAGTLYGTAYYGGDPACILYTAEPGCGVIFKITP